MPELVQITAEIIVHPSQIMKAERIGNDTVVRLKDGLSGGYWITDINKALWDAIKAHANKY